MPKETIKEVFWDPFELNFVLQDMINFHLTEKKQKIALSRLRRKSRQLDMYDRNEVFSAVLPLRENERRNTGEPSK